MEVIAWRVENAKEIATWRNHAENAIGSPQEFALQRLAEEPKLHAQSKLYYMAYMELQNDRPPAPEGLCSIPGSAIRDFCDEEGFHGWQRDQLKRVIRAVDNHEVRLVNEQRRQAMEKPSKGR